MKRTLLLFATRPRNLLACVACLGLVAAIVTASAHVVDTDVWWVAAAGRLMLHGGRVIRENTFSYTDPGHAFIMHEWLLGPLYAFGLERWGPAFFNAVAVATLGLGVTLLGTWATRQARHATTALLVLLVALVCFSGRFLSARPTGLALLFPLAMVWLAFRPTFTPFSGALAVLLELVWSNTHGSFLLGPLLLVVATWDQRGARRARIVTAAAMAVVSLVNPYGPELHRFVIEYLLGRRDIFRAIHQDIDGFRPLWDAWGRTTGPVEALGLVALAALAASAALRPAHRARGMASLALIGLAVLNARHVELAGLVACMLLVGHLDELMLHLQLPEPPTRWRRHALLGALLPVWLGGSGVFAGLAPRRSRAEWLGERTGFVHALERVQRGAHAYVPFRESGLAIWYGFPRGLRVFYDARNDCYSVATHRAFFALQSSRTPPARIRQLLATTDAIVVPPSHRLARFAAHAPAWRLADRSGGWIVYERKRQ